jgi:hypothetical protein
LNKLIAQEKKSGLGDEIEEILDSIFRERMIEDMKRLNEIK